MSKMILIEEAKVRQALEALKEYVNVVTSSNDPHSWCAVADGGKPAREAITALRTAIHATELREAAQSRSDVEKQSAEERSSVERGEPVSRTDQQIVDQTEELALWLLSWGFNRQPETDAPMRESAHPMAKRCWSAACHIQEMLTNTDPENSVAELDVDDTPPTAPVQEPVAYAVYHRMGGSKTLHWPEQHSEDGDAKEYKLVPLYTTPPYVATQLAAQEEIQRLSALVRAQQITIEKLEASTEKAHDEQIP